MLQIEFQLPGMGPYAASVAEAIMRQSLQANMNGDAQELTVVHSPFYDNLITVVKGFKTILIFDPGSSPALRFNGKLLV